ncbi:MAG: flagellar hook-basal body complex protein FliE [Defluviitaleaceae bacterium]|nr:flagellar hook-basal body complex protein FliE [Defluviitaleaceae bacterium]
MTNAINAIDVNGVNNNVQSLINNRPVAENGNTFEMFYNAAINLINEVNEHQRSSYQLQLDFATGRTDDVLAVMMAQEKAHASLNFTVQVTSRIVEAYREIMRMQI